MKVKLFRIPKQIVLPGLLVTVRQLPSDHPSLGKTPACKACGSLEGAAADATWEYDETTAVINLNARASIRRKRYLVIHELGHVMWDYLHDVRDNHKHVVDKP